MNHGRRALWLLLAPIAYGQAIEIRSLYEPAPLAGVWKYQTGEGGAAWAEPGFDDSSWRQVNLPGAAHPIEAGYLWYRLRVRLPTPLPAEQLSVLMGPIAPAYEIWANGERIGSFGGAAGSPWGQAVPAPKAFPLPPGAPNLVLAIRTWHVSRPWGFHLPDFSVPSWVATAESIRLKIAEEEGARLIHSSPAFLIIAATMLAGAFFVMLPLWRHDASEYFWCGCLLISACIARLLQISRTGALSLSYGIAVITVPYVYSWVRFLEALFQVRRSVFTSVGAGLIYASVAVNVALMTWAPALSPSFAPPARALIFAGLAAIYAEFARGREGLRAIHIAVALYFAGNLLMFAQQGLYAAGLPVPPPEIVVGGAVIELRAVALLLFAFAMAVLLNQRAASLAAEQERLKQELAAAAQVQALLLASASREVPGFTVETAYLPASEVGGDFFYLRPVPDGGLLVVVGDVSGKGLKAAMLVSLIIGALRSEERSEPAVVLGTLNRSLTDQVQGGFVTACCVRVEAGGLLSLANAGHIAPWIDGVEATVEPSLPLGLDPDLEVASSTLLLAPHQTITLVSDGVVEAANPQGELLGFARAAELSAKPARELADAAKAWGQNDDITVVTITSTSGEFRSRS